MADESHDRWRGNSKYRPIRPSYIGAIGKICRATSRLLTSPPSQQRRRQSWRRQKTNYQRRNLWRHFTNTQSFPLCVKSAKPVMLDSSCTDTFTRQLMIQSIRLGTFPNTSILPNAFEIKILTQRDKDVDEHTTTKDGRYRCTLHWLTTTMRRTKIWLISDDGPQGDTVRTE